MECGVVERESSYIQLDSCSVKSIVMSCTWQALEKPKNDEKAIAGLSKMLGLTKSEPARVKLDKLKEMQEFNVVLRDINLKVTIR